MILLGSTGSIGVNTLNVARKFNLPLGGKASLSVIIKEMKRYNPMKVDEADMRKRLKLMFNSGLLDLNPDFA